MRKVNWDVEELVVLISIYDRSLKGVIIDLDSELQHLSSVLNKRAEQLNIPRDEKYRNVAGMKMMYQNLMYIANGETKGLSNVSQAMRIVFDMYQKCPSAFSLIQEEFWKKYAG